MSDTLKIYLLAWAVCVVVALSLLVKDIIKDLIFKSKLKRMKNQQEQVAALSERYGFDWQNHIPNGVFMARDVELEIAEDQSFPDDKES